MIITLKHVYYEIHDEVRKNDKVHNSFINNLHICNTWNIFLGENPYRNLYKLRFSNPYNFATKCCRP